MDLSQIDPGMRAVVTKVNNLNHIDPLGQRLAELGFVPGAVVTVMHRAPLARDPVSVVVRGTHVALRRVEAQRVLVEHYEAKGSVAL